MHAELCGLGNALMDVLILLESDQPLQALGLNKGQMHLKTEAEWQQIWEAVRHLPYETSPGGSCANTISTAALMGTQAAFCGQVGQDELGAKYASAMAERCGRHSIHLEPNSPTGKCLSLISPDAERTMITTLGCAIELAPEDLFEDAIRQARHLHVTGYLFTGGRMGETARQALKVAKAAGVQISFDVSDTWVVETLHSLTWELIDEYVDIVFTNADEAKTLCRVGEAEDAADMLANRCKIAVIKLGSKGSLIVAGEARHRIPVYPVKAVDSTGAGDSYAGAFLSGLLAGKSLEACGHLASRVAAETVSQRGAVVTAPGRLLELARKA